VVNLSLWYVRPWLRRYSRMLAETEAVELSLEGLLIMLNKDYHIIHVRIAPEG
jgi:hypothetical protein